MGYGQSKLLGARTYSLRISQVSGLSKKGLWNESEVISLMIRSALTLRALPKLCQECSWLPVDKLALVVLELAESCSAPDRDVRLNRVSDPSGVAYINNSIYHVYNSRGFPWSELLAALRRNGFQFQILLRESEARSEENINPAVNLIHHYEMIHGAESPIRQNGTRVFMTDKAERESVTLRNGRLSIVEDGILDCYARNWFMRWMTFLSR
ncbi:hypothetical protein N7447_002593, partial [Penicillium robsamsonii]|uniref:uncharacterized protein n=1 Tax=Penicillium robsamsonii TaxID=1792511 RepID=UPI002547B9CB